MSIKKLIGFVSIKSMKRVLTVRVESFEEGLTQFRRAWQSGRFRGEFVTFETMADMARALTPSRFELLRTLQAQGSMMLRALARLLKRDVKSVHRDVAPLKELGLVENHQNDISVPYDEIRAEFTLRRKPA